VTEHVANGYPFRHGAGIEEVEPRTTDCSRRRRENSLLVMLSYTIPSEKPGGAATSELCSPHTMLVNKSGLRFADETFFQGINAAATVV